MPNQTSAGLMLQTIMMLMKETSKLQRCYGPYGCFSSLYPVDNRTVEDLGVKYLAFTRRNRAIPMFIPANNTDTIHNSNLATKGPFFFIAHGYLEDGDKQRIQDTTDALLNLEGNDNATVFVVDWQPGSYPPSSQALANLRRVGFITALLINNMYEVFELSDLDNFHFIGHSLGAHLGGYCGRALLRDFNLKLGRITGLDPVEPPFDATLIIQTPPVETLVRLDWPDADYVDIIKPNAVSTEIYETFENIGHVSFYPNVQPGCPPIGSSLGSGDITKTTVKSVACHRESSCEYFIKSIATSCPLLGVQCESYDAFLAGKCICDPQHNCIPMGYHSHRSIKRLRADGYLDYFSSINIYALTGSSNPDCRVPYKVELAVSTSVRSRAALASADEGRVAITLIDKNGNESSAEFLDEKKYYKPGEIETKMVAFKDARSLPVSVLVEWQYISNSFSLLTWRLLNASSIYIEYLKLTSIEYNKSITVCPQMEQPVFANIRTRMMTIYCKTKNK